MKLKRPSIFSIVIIAAIVVTIIALVIMIVSTITSGKGIIDEDIDKVDSISGNKNISVDEDGNKINISNDMLRKRESDGFVFDSFDITTKNGVSTIGFEIYNPSEEDRELGKYELKIIDEYGNVIGRVVDDAGVVSGLSRREVSLNVKGDIANLADIQISKIISKEV